MVVNTVHWFRKGLRFHDNPALGESITKADTLRCVYILDPWFAGWITKRGNQQVEEWKITRLSYEDDSEPFGKDRDAAIRKLATKAGVEVFVRISHTHFMIWTNGGLVGQLHKLSQRERGSILKRHIEDQTSGSASKIQRKDST
nr:cryptochrome-1b [Misgurnus anguillicaudatus]XP_055030961.1 cryptochrome-1b [Misgurnus anguillicaudatus]